MTAIAQPKAELPPTARPTSGSRKGGLVVAVRVVVDARLVCERQRSFIAVWLKVSASGNGHFMASATYFD